MRKKTSTGFYRLLHRQSSVRGGYHHAAVPEHIKKLKIKIFELFKHKNLSGICRVDHHVSESEEIFKIGEFFDFVLVSIDFEVIKTDVPTLKN